MEKTLNAEEMPLHKVFSDDFLFTIPSVQRPYSWTPEEAGELLDDLFDYIEHQSIKEANIAKVKEPYFLGSIVLVKKAEAYYEVLDGQQRLTTLTILLAVLRDYLGGEYANSIKNMLARQGNFLLQTKDRYRIELRKRDQSFFQKYIQEDGATIKLKQDTEVKTDSQKYIRDNAIYFIDQLNEADSDVVKTLPGIIYGLCYLVIVSTPSFDSAFRIFTVLNDRGLDLMPSDIIKARAIGDVSDEEQNDYTAKWEEAEVALGRERFNKLFEHIRMIIQKRKGSRNIKDEYNLIFSQLNGKEFIDDYLIPYSEIYLKLVDYQTFYQNDPKMIKMLSLMNQIDNADWLTVAMYYTYHIGEQFEEFLLRLETFAATSMILRRNFNWRMSKYSQVLKEMEIGVDVFSERSTLELSNEERIDVISQLNGDVYISLKDTAKRYILLRLDSLLTKGQPYYNHSVITVEHVLPQKPNEGSEWLKVFDKTEDCVHKLGNLVLLTRQKNSKAKNFDFEKKKASYFQASSGVTSFALTSQVIQMNEWTPEVVKKRQHQLLQLLVDTWGLVEKVSPSVLADENYYIETITGLKAVGYPTDSGFLVEKGGIVSSEFSNSVKSGTVNLRDELIDKQILVRHGEFLTFTQDYEFSSPSAASSLVFGRSSNGLTSWKLANGKTLKEVQEK
ncbi:DUF4357 domain-containing protein [Aquibacillus halophilus]|uniref:DUF4357 domain-containing protein n=1 Tax=Aquibacillus halophilus TaxID=930132 RepID=UPI001478F9CF|nr:DUF4357 domain-containing protein [Aquibacillus halophilus]